MLKRRKLRKLARALAALERDARPVLRETVPRKTVRVSFGG